MSDAQRADEWRHRFWIDAMREFVAELKRDAETLRQPSEGDDVMRTELRNLTAGTIERIARDLDAEVTRLERWQ